MVEKMDRKKAPGACEYFSFPQHRKVTAKNLLQLMYKNSLSHRNRSRSTLSALKRENRWIDQDWNKVEVMDEEWREREGIDLWKMTFMALTQPARNTLSRRADETFIWLFSSKMIDFCPEDQVINLLMRLWEQFRFDYHCWRESFLHPSQCPRRVTKKQNQIITEQRAIFCCTSDINMVTQQDRMSRRIDTCVLSLTIKSIDPWVTDKSAILDLMEWRLLLRRCRFNEMPADRYIPREMSMSIWSFSAGSIECGAFHWTDWWYMDKRRERGRQCTKPPRQAPREKRDRHRQRRRRVLIPQFHDIVPSSCKNPRLFMPMPFGIDADIVVRLDLFVHACALPVPDNQPPISITTDQIGHIRWEVQTTSIARHLDEITCRSASHRRSYSPYDLWRLSCSSI